jgi:hypothetical protein
MTEHIKTFKAILKKLIKNMAFLVLLLIILAVGLGLLDFNIAEQNIPSSETRGQYFKVRDISGSENYKYLYEYSIFTRGYELLDDGVIDKYPEISYPDISKWDGFIKLSAFYFGMGGETCRYYDIDKGLVSKWFWFSVGESDGLTIRVDEPASAHKLIAESIFDDSYYREFSIDFLQGWGNVFKMKQQTPVVSVEFINDNKQLRVKYLDKEDHERTKTLDLY